MTLFIALDTKFDDLPAYVKFVETPIVHEFCAAGVLGNPKHYESGSGCFLAIYQCVLEIPLNQD